MRVFRILWLDDDFVKNSPSFPKLNNLRMTLDGILDKLDFIKVELIECSSGDDATLKIIDNSTQYDLYILDLELDDKATPTGFKVLERLNKVQRNRSVVILSDNLPKKNEPDTKNYGEKLIHFKNAYLSAFNKSMDGIEELGKFIVNYIQKPALSLIVISDIHSGYITSENHRAKAFEAVLLNEFKNITHSHKPDYLLATGDFAYKSQKDDLPIAASFINKLRTELNMRGDKQFHFCPGNHDVSLLGGDGWSNYHNFVNNLADLEPNIIKRFKTYDYGNLEEFNVQRDICSVSTGVDENVLFVSLNSVELVKSNTDDRFAVVPRIGELQWQYLKRKLNSMATPNDQLRIAMLHHPLYPTPSVDYANEEQILRDQAKAMQTLNDLGFQLVIHGHTHFPCIHEHKRTVLNSAGSLHTNSRKIITIAAPTLGGEPSAATPLRQYLIVQVGYFDPGTKSRSLSIITRVYDAEGECWKDGAVIHEGKYVID